LVRKIGLSNGRRGLNLKNSYNLFRYFQLYPSSSRRIYIPILPLKVGAIAVTIEGITGVKRDIITKTIQVVV